MTSSKDKPSEYGGKRGLFQGGDPRTASEVYMAERQAMRKEEEAEARRQEQAAQKHH